jgi:hypothetical protein
LEKAETAETLGKGIYARLFRRVSLRPEKIPKIGVDSEAANRTFLPSVFLVS